MKKSSFIVGMLLSFMMIFSGQDCLAQPNSGNAQANDGAANPAPAPSNEAAPGNDAQKPEHFGHHHHHHHPPMSPLNPPIMSRVPRHPPACFDPNCFRDFKPEITGGLKKEGIRLTIHQHASDVESCFAPEVAKNPKLEGMVGIHWLLERDGKVTKVFLKKTTLNNEAVEKCLVDSIATWTFPRGQNAGIGQIKHWFVFKEGKYVED